MPEFKKVFGDNSNQMDVLLVLITLLDQSSRLAWMLIYGLVPLPQRMESIMSHFPTIRSTTPPKINLSLRNDEPPFMVDMQAFFEFSFWMAEALLDLEAQFGDSDQPHKVRK